jgi:hypothetical protein
MERRTHLDPEIVKRKMPLQRLSEMQASAFQRRLQSEFSEQGGDPAQADKKAKRRGYGFFTPEQIRFGRIPR